MDKLQFLVLITIKGWGEFSCIKSSVIAYNVITLDSLEWVDEHEFIAKYVFNWM